MDGKELQQKRSRRKRFKKKVSKTAKWKINEITSNWKKSLNGYKLPHETETMSTLTILFCNLIIPQFVFGESVQESMSMA